MAVHSHLTMYMNTLAFTARDLVLISKNMYMVLAYFSKEFGQDLEYQLAFHCLYCQ